MSEFDTMESVIEDSINDAALDTSSVDTSTDVAVDTTDTSTESLAVDSPAVDDPLGSVDPTTPAQDDFEKRWGIPSRSVTGRENRIPHSRVKQMVTKAEAEALARAAKDAESKFSPQLTEFQTKVKDYEDRLTKVAQFEHVLENDPRTFLSLLSQLPAYKGFFDHLNRLAQGQAQPAQQPTSTLDHSDMPQPDQVLPDGSRVYSLEGLAKRDEWLAKKIEDRTVRQAEERFSSRIAPFEQERAQQQRLQQMVPVIEKQIAEARTWPNFAELEPDIIKALRADPNVTLDRAYVKAYQDKVVPKISADRNKMRTDILAELRQKSVASSAPVSAVKPGNPGANANRSLEQIIADSLKEAGHTIN